MTVPVDHIEKLRAASTKVITGLHEMRQVFQEIEGFCLDWVDEAGALDEPQVIRAEEPTDQSENATPAPEPVPEPAPEPEHPTLEEVRGVLAALAQAGKADQVRELLRTHGADKLSDVEPQHRAALITEAKAIQ
ncbi:rRNA biogenesis protein rrp5 [Corynebacterium sp. LK26]|uniref:rRNA biogenesis protein rrp5 n=1 Tax=Corynebacterium sp. LK26 TaxID=2044581 RepID=UPI00165258B8|nr:rRNA biogenesis protein rrp5 [Corynebacterium sp. LK26]MBC6792669.1 rRNA biogenesis protein rrp5 [Corynebacterium sp. LK26]